MIAAMRFDDTDEALALANSTRYGPAAGIWTSDLNRTLLRVQELKAGQVFVNTYGVGGGVELPFGAAVSGVTNAEKGFAALSEYTRLKTLAISFGNFKEQQVTNSDESKEEAREPIGL